MPPVSYSFALTLLMPPDVGGWDMRFQRISGFQVSMQPEEVREGGQNLYAQYLPMPYKYSNLVLERGLTQLSMLNIQCQIALNTFRFNPATALVALLDENDSPVASWLFLNAYPIRWSSSDLDANANSLVIDTIELTYTRFMRLTL